MKRASSSIWSPSWAPCPNCPASFSRILRPSRRRRHSPIVATRSGSARFLLSSSECNASRPRPRFRGVRLLQRAGRRSLRLCGSTNRHSMRGVIRVEQPETFVRESDGYRDLPRLAGVRDTSSPPRLGPPRWRWRRVPVDRSNPNDEIGLQQAYDASPPARGFQMRSGFEIGITRRHRCGEHFGVPGGRPAFDRHREHVGLHGGWVGGTATVPDTASRAQVQATATSLAAGRGCWTWAAALVPQSATYSSATTGTRCPGRARRMRFRPRAGRSFPRFAIRSRASFSRR